MSYNLIDAFGYPILYIIQQKTLKSLKSLDQNSHKKVEIRTIFGCKEQIYMRFALIVCYFVVDKVDVMGNYVKI